MSSYLFVYGTLMSNETNEFSLLIKKHTKFIGKGFIYANKYDLGEYPGIKLDHTKKDKTFGELYKIINNSILLFEALDFYEGYDISNINNSLFIRKETIAYIKSNSYPAWVYEYAKEL